MDEVTNDSVVRNVGTIEDKHGRQGRMQEFKSIKPVRQSYGCIYLQKYRPPLEERATSDTQRKKLVIE